MVPATAIELSAKRFHVGLDPGRIVADWSRLKDEYPPARAASLAAVMAAGREGIFQLRAAPTLDQLNRHLRGFEGEIGLLKLFGDWYISYNDETETDWGESASFLVRDFRDLIGRVQGHGVADFDLHSHPGTDPYSFVPSLADRYALTNTENRTAYIWTERGILEFADVHREARDCKTSPEHQFCSYMYVEREMTSQQIDNLGFAEILRQFYTDKFRLRWLDDAAAHALFPTKARFGCSRSLTTTRSDQA